MNKEKLLKAREIIENTDFINLNDDLIMYDHNRQVYLKDHPV